jgi:metal-sulfur cluster biosynthetic enzyme
LTTTTSSGLRAEDILESLTRVIDPEYGINIVDLGLVYGIELAHGTATIQMTMTAPEAPHQGEIVGEIHDIIRRRHPMIDEIVVDVIREPEWREDFITEAGQMQLLHPVRPGDAGPGAAMTKDDVLQSLKLVLDPEVGVNIVDLGLIYGVTVAGTGVHIEMTLTTPGCPLHATIEQAVRRVLETRHPAITDIQLELVWEPAWDVDKITPAGKAELGW